MKRRAYHYLVAEKTKDKLIQASFYDDWGRVEKEVQYGPSGKKEATIFYEYEGGKTIREKTVNEAGYHQDTDYVYDRNGHLAFERFTYSDGSRLEEKRVKNGLIERITTREPNGEISKEELVEYDEWEQIIRYDLLEDGNLIERSEYAYDEDGKMLTRKIINYQEVSHYSVHWEYDAAGNEISELFLSESGSKLKEITREFKGSLLIQENRADYFSQLDSQEERWTYTYDSRGSLVREKCVGFEGRILFDNEFGYNDMGDIVLSKHFEAGNFNGIDGSGNVGSKSVIRIDIDYEV